MRNALLGLFVISILLSIFVPSKAQVKEEAVPMVMWTTPREFTTLDEVSKFLNTLPMERAAAAKVILYPEINGMRLSLTYYVFYQIDTFTLR